VQGDDVVAAGESRWYRAARGSSPNVKQATARLSMCRVCEECLERTGLKGEIMRRMFQFALDDCLPLTVAVELVSVSRKYARYRSRAFAYEEAANAKLG
jgi:hypothetical protein